VGTAGEELHDLAAQYPFVATQFKRNGFLDVHISNNGTRLTALAKQMEIILPLPSSEILQND
jgi:hypothetical protein